MHPSAGAAVRIDVDAAVSAFGTDMGAAAVGACVGKDFGGDEVGVLVDNFKKMQSSINQQQEKLEKFNQELQEKVAERTAELTTLSEISKELSVSDNARGIFNCVYKHIALDNS